MGIKEEEATIFPQGFASSSGSLSKKKGGELCQETIKYEQVSPCLKEITRMATL